MSDGAKPLVLITGAGGNIGRSLAAELVDRFRVVGLDREAEERPVPILAADFTSDEAMAAAFARLRDAHGSRIDCVVHLVAYYDFTGAPDPLYDAVNVAGTRSLLRQLQAFDVGRFVYASTMLVHRPGRPGKRIDETQPIDPRWAYPQSKAAAERAIGEERGDIPVTILRLAGVYDEATMVPTLAQQMARIYDRAAESYFYSGPHDVGQAMLHREDMIAAFVAAIDRRDALSDMEALLIGEAETLGYDDIQDRLGCLIHGEKNWPTLRVPKTIAAAGVWAQDRLEPIIPDAIDQGEQPFIRPFMIFMADDHYALDIGKAERLLGWRPRHRLSDMLPAMVADLKADPAAWHARNRVTPPAWLAEADAAGLPAEPLRANHVAALRAAHRRGRWTHLVNIGLGTWLITQPPLIEIRNAWYAGADIVLGAALMLCAALALSWRAQWARWACAGIGALVAAAPFVFWTEVGAAYLSDTLLGGMIMLLAVAGPPEPGPSPIAALTGPDVPPGWSYNPSTWRQRIPIILLALVGLYVSRYLAAYQLDLIDDVWDPFFAGSAADPQNGTEEIITSSVSEAWPVPDGAVGGYTYLLEIVTGAIGTRARWRTMPWLVVLFGLMIVPLGVVSISFIIIQPIVIGTWSTIALIGAAAMLVQIPYALDELLASVQFLVRRVRAGQNWLRVFLAGDTDEGERPVRTDELDAPPGAIVKDMLIGGVSLPWNLAAAALIGISLMFTRLSLGTTGTIADADHLIGALVLTVVSIAAAEVARPARLVLVPLGVALIATPFLLETSGPSMINNLLCGVALIGLSARRGRIRERYGDWNRRLI